LIEKFLTFGKYLTLPFKPNLAARLQRVLCSLQEV
jgi:hypothetical protein